MRNCQAIRISGGGQAVLMSSMSGTNQAARALVSMSEEGWQATMQRQDASGNHAGSASP